MSKMLKIGQHFVKCWRRWRCTFYFSRATFL